MLRKGSDKVCPLSVLVQHPSGDGDEGDPCWISKWTTNWRGNGHEPLLRWWHRPVNHFGGRTTGVGGMPRLNQPQIQPTHQRQQDQFSGEWQHSVPHTHWEYTILAGGYFPVPLVPCYRRWWVYNGIPYQVKQRAGDRVITAEMWKSHNIPI